MLLCCVATLLTAYCAGSYSPPVAIMEAEFHASRTAVVTGITTFCVGFALAPMVLAPFSEINGRYPVFSVSGVVFVVFQLACGFVTNLAGMLACRFLVGVGGSVFSTMIGGIIADLWDKEGRNTPMAVFSGSVLGKHNGLSFSSSPSAMFWFLHSSHHSRLRDGLLLTRSA